MALATPEQQRILKRMNDLTNTLGRLTEGTETYLSYKRQLAEAKRECINIYTKLNNTKI